MARVSRKAICQPAPKAEAEEQIRIWNAALYVRLSVEDNGKESDSIENQTKLLETYVESKPYLRKVELLVDNGFTGTNFERPGYSRMIERIQHGEVDCIVVKDLSRLGRDYIETSRFIERFCPFYGIRFIAVNDAYDTETVTSGGQLSVSLSNIINDYYAKDISRKSSSALHAKMQRGEFVANYAPYGYTKDPEDKNRLIVCEETAEIVRKIFAWRLESVSYMGICKRLNEAKTPSPGEYRLAHGIETQNNRRPKTILWNKHVLTEILQNRVYIGQMVQGKHNRCLYAGIPEHATTPQEQYVVLGTHEPIIDAQTWERVQQINREQAQRTIEHAGKYDDLPKARNIYGRRLVCACCGRAMKLHRSFSTNRDKAYFMFKCPTYAEHGKMGCTDIKIRKQDLDAAILESIKAQAAALAEQQKTLVKLVAARKKQPVRDDHKETVRSLENKLERKQAILSSLYADLKDGIITQSDYRHHREVLLRDIQSLRTQISEFGAIEDDASVFLSRKREWMEKTQRFFDATELSPEMVQMFVESIVIHEDSEVEIKFSIQNELEHLRAFNARLSQGAA